MKVFVGGFLEVLLVFFEAGRRLALGVYLKMVRICCRFCWGCKGVLDLETCIDYFVLPAKSCQNPNCLKSPDT